MRHESNETVATCTTTTNSTLSSTLGDRDCTVCGICHLPLYDNRKDDDASKKDPTKAGNDSNVIVTCANYENDGTNCHNTSCSSNVSPHYHIDCTDVPQRSELYIRKSSMHHHNSQRQQKNQSLSIAAQNNSTHFKYEEDEKYKQTLLYFCPSCDVQGTSRYLLEYFENFRRQKVRFYNDEECVRFKDCRHEAFVLDLIRAATSSQNQTLNRSKKQSIFYKKTEIQSTAILNIWDQLHGHRGNTTCTVQEVQNKHDYPKKSPLPPNIDKIDPTIFIGQPVRIFCDVSNSYHVGRIIDWRTNTSETERYDNAEEDPSCVYFDKYYPPTKHKTDSSEKATKSFGKCHTYDNSRKSKIRTRKKTKLELDTNVSQTEYLVRFRAGIDGRKLPVHQWLFLEEHPLMVSVALVWAKVMEVPNNIHASQNGNPNNNNKDSPNSQKIIYRPAQLILRTALEMVPVAEIQNHLMPQVLALFFGQHFQQSILKLSSTPSRNDVKMDQSTQLFDASSYAPSIVDFTNIPPKMERISRDIRSRDRMLQINTALACMEKEEQRRIRNWHGLDPANNIDCK